MLDSKGFDLWADGYDQSVGLSDEDGTYPFAGYKQILNEIYFVADELTESFPQMKFERFTFCSGLLFLK